MKHEFQPGHLMPTHCRVYIEREGFCGLPASHDLHMPESEGEMSQSSEQGAPELKPCPFAHTPQQIAQLQNPTPYVSDGFNEDGYWQVICPVCLAATGCCEIKENAIERWNTRTRSDICAAADCEKASILDCINQELRENEAGFQATIDDDPRAAIRLLVDAVRQKERRACSDICAELVEALEELYVLIEKGDLVRDVTNDDKWGHFAAQGLRITKALDAACTALAQVKEGVN